MNKLDPPLRLAVGSYQPDSGKGCAMNVISWENGDTEITDTPGCVEPVLAVMVQVVNDWFCTHDGIEDTGLLCPACSVQVLTLAHRTVGTKLTESTSPVGSKEVLYLDPDVRRWLFELQKLFPLFVRGSRFRWLDWEQIADQIRVNRGLATPHRIIDHFKAHFGVNAPPSPTAPPARPGRADRVPQPYLPLRSDCRRLSGPPGAHSANVPTPPR